MQAEVLSKLDELIAATRAASIPLDERWLDAEGVGALLGFRPRYIMEKIACRPGFPQPLRLAGSGHPRWLAKEIQEWAMQQRRAK